MKRLGLKDAIFEFLRSDCDKQIHFDGRTLEFSGLGAGFGGAKFSLASFKTSREKIRAASETAMAIDDYQWQMCKIAHEYDKGDPERRRYNRWRTGAAGLFASLRATLATFRVDPSDKLRHELESLVRDMNEFARDIAKAVAPRPLNRARKVVRIRAYAHARGGIESATHAIEQEAPILRDDFEYHGPSGGTVAEGKSAELVILPSPKLTLPRRKKPSSLAKALKRTNLRPAEVSRIASSA